VSLCHGQFQSLQNDVDDDADYQAWSLPPEESQPHLGVDNQLETDTAQSSNSFIVPVYDAFVSSVIII